jgi:hypothetical protein
MTLQNANTSLHHHEEINTDRGFRLCVSLMCIASKAFAQQFWARSWLLSKAAKQSCTLTVCAPVHCSSSSMVVVAAHVFLWGCGL